MPPIAHRIDLTLPLPPAVNQWPSHPMALHRAKNDYRRDVWIEAVMQALPLLDPPEFVMLDAHFYVHNLRDEDGLTGCLKWVLDALKLEQTGDVWWRQGLADKKGYFVDDDPKHLRVAKPTQEIERDNIRLLLTLTWGEQEEAA